MLVKMGSFLNDAKHAKTIAIHAQANNDLPSFEQFEFRKQFLYEYQNLNWVLGVSLQVPAYDMVLVVSVDTKYNTALCLSSSGTGWFYLSHLEEINKIEQEKSEKDAKHLSW